MSMLAEGPPGRRIMSNSEDVHVSETVIFASCLDNTRRCYLMLKYAFLPLSCLFGALAVLQCMLWFFGYVEQFSIIYVFNMCVTFVITGAPIPLVPAILQLRRVTASVRLTLTHILFASVCLLVPVFNTHFIWHRRYREINGFLLVHEFFPRAPLSVRAAAVSMDEPLSICDDNFFYILFVIDHALMMVSRFILPMVIQLPLKFSSVIFSVHAFLSWASAVRIMNVYIDTCSNQPASAANAAIAKLYLPLGHMAHVGCFLPWIFTFLFVSSQNREQNKKWARLLLMEGISTIRIHLNAIFSRNAQPKPRQVGTFWSRTELLYSQQEKPPLLLPSSVGIALKVSLGLRDWGLYVWALSVTIYFAVFELMQLFIHVDPHIRQIVYTSFRKCVVLFVCVSAPHFLLAKGIYQGRVRFPFLITLCCFVTIILCVLFVLPGTSGWVVWNHNVRFLLYIVAINISPPAILRAISHFASSKFIVVAFALLHMYRCPSSLHLQSSGLIFYCCCCYCLPAHLTLTRR